MKKNFFYGIVSVPLFLLGGFLWILSSVPADSMKYIENIGDPASYIKTLNFFQLNDMPGYFGAMGRSDAKDQADLERVAELNGFDEVNSVGYSLTRKGLLPECISRLHAQRLYLFEMIKEIPTSGIMSNSDRIKLIKEISLVSNSKLKCQELALRAKDWRVTLWSSITDRLLPDATSGKSESPSLPTKDSAVAVSNEMNSEIKTAPEAPPRAVSKEINLEIKTAPDASPKPAAPRTEVEENCRIEFKKLIIAQVSVFTEANESAVVKNCREHVKEWMCFLDKAKNQGTIPGYGTVSLAEQGIFRQQCGIEEME